MEEKSAYEQLEYLYEKTDLLATCYTSNLFSHVAVHQFLNMTQSKVFLQIYEQYIDTQIATVSLPTPQTINDGKDKSKEIESIFIKYPKIDVYAFKHCDLTVSVSYVKFLESFAITHKGNTQFFKANHQFSELKQFDNQLNRVFEIACCFFNVINQLSLQEQEYLKLDLENRSIIGMYCYKWILWVGILDHYGKQPLHHPNTTKDFLDHYGFQLVQVVCYKNTEYKKFDEICNTIRNQYIFDFNDMDRGTTLYLWSDKQYLGNYYIPHKHYEILDDFKQIIKERRQVPSNFLAKYQLSQEEINFYWRYFGEFISFNSDLPITFSTLTSNTFNRMLLNIRRPQKLDHRYSLSQCINPQVVVIIPIGFCKYPLFSLYDQFTLNPYSTILEPKNLKIDYKHQIYCYAKVVDYASFLQLGQTLQKNKNTTIVGLFQVSKQGFKLLNGKQLPFSLEFIIYSLLQLTNTIEDFQNSLSQLTKFSEIEHSKLKASYICECNLIPNQQEIQRLIKEYDLENEFQQLFNTDPPSQTIFDKFKRISQQLQKENTKFYQEESHCIIRRISQITQIFFRSSRQQNFNQIIYSKNIEKIPDQPIIPKYMYLTRDSWSDIEDYIADVMDIIVDRSKQGKSQINKEIIKMKDSYIHQIFHKGKQFFYKNTQPFVLNVQDLEVTLVIQLCIVVMDGLIILVPEKKNLISHIVVMTQQLESDCAQQILDLTKENIEKLSKDNVVEQSSFVQSINFRSKEWNTYIVKFPSPKIILQQ